MDIAYRLGVRYNLALEGYGSNHNEAKASKEKREWQTSSRSSTSARPGCRSAR